MADNINDTTICVRKSCKDGVSINVDIGEELFDSLEKLCSITGQSKTVAVERAIRNYCANPTVPNEDGK